MIALGCSRLLNASLPPPPLSQFSASEQSRKTIVSRHLQKMSHRSYDVFWSIGHHLILWTVSPFQDLRMFLTMFLFQVLRSFDHNTFPQTPSTLQNFPPEIEI